MNSTEIKIECQESIVVIRLNAIFCFTEAEFNDLNKCFLFSFFQEIRIYIIRVNLIKCMLFDIGMYPAIKKR